MPDELEDVLLRTVKLAQLPPEEPISQWIATPDAQRLKLRARDHALILGECEYHVHADGRIEVRDYTDPRSMRFQCYDPNRPLQPYMHPSQELDTLARA
jgi:hypothetical protein